MKLIQGERHGVNKVLCGEDRNPIILCINAMRFSTQCKAFIIINAHFQPCLQCCSVSVWVLVCSQLCWLLVDSYEFSADIPNPKRVTMNDWSQLVTGKRSKISPWLETHFSLKCTGFQYFCFEIVSEGLGFLTRRGRHLHLHAFLFQLLVEAVPY